MEPDQKILNEEKRILLVEDDNLIRDLYSRILKKEGYTIEEASDGVEAYGMILSGGYDLILLDLMLPNMSGVEILKSLKTQTPKTPNKGIIILTNLDQETVIANTLEMGASRYYVKDQTSPEKIVEVVKRHLNSGT